MIDFKQKKYLKYLFLFVFILFFSVLGKVVLAQGTVTDTNLDANSMEGAIATVVAWIFYWISTGLNRIVTIAVEVMLYVMTFPLNINKIQAINNGWMIVRDIFNNFFIVILLIIAVGTTLRIDKYRDYKTLLTRLLLYAVLINFSKLFTGLMIDASQILMLTFAKPLSSITGNNIILGALGLPNLYSVGDAKELYESNGFIETLTALIFAVIVTVVALVVIVAIISILVYRMIGLMFLTILSPAPYFLQTFPQGQSYVGEWWKLMTNFLITGPVMVFFLWISFSIMAVGAEQIYKGNGVIANETQQQTQSNSQNPNVAALEKKYSKMLTKEGVLNFMIVVGMLVMSVYMGQKVGGSTAGAAGKAFGRLKGWGEKIKSLPKEAAVKVDDKVGLRAGATGAAYRMGGKYIPFLGNTLAEKNAQYKKGTMDRQEAVRRNAAQVRNVDNLTANQRRKIATSRRSTSAERAAAVRAMLKSGEINDNDAGLINSVRSSMRYNDRAAFENDVKKANPSLALKSDIYKKFDGSINTDMLETDIKSGKIDAAKMMANIDADTLKNLKLSTGNTNDSVAKFLMETSNYDDKKMASIFSGMSEAVKNEVQRGVTNQTFAGHPDADARRESYMKASSDFDFDKLYQAGEETKRNAFVSKNNDLIASNVAADQLANVVSTVGDALSPQNIEKIKNRSDEMKEALKTSFEGVGANIDGVDAAKDEKLMRNAMLAGSNVDLGSGNTAAKSAALQAAMNSRSKDDIIANLNHENVNDHFVAATQNILKTKDFQAIAEKSADHKTKIQGAITSNFNSNAVSNPDEERAAINLMLGAAATGATIDYAASANAARNQSLFETEVAQRLTDDHIRNGNFANNQIDAIAVNGNIGAIKSFLNNPGTNVNQARELTSALRATLPARRNKFRDYI